VRTLVIAHRDQKLEIEVLAGFSTANDIRDPLRELTSLSRAR
jgi:hypothetical protein